MSALTPPNNNAPQPKTAKQAVANFEKRLMRASPGNDAVNVERWSALSVALMRKACAGHLI